MKYDLILADPPWQYQNKASNGAAHNHYNTTDFYSLTRLPIETIVNDNSVLCMWYTGNFALEAIRLAEAWGFKVKTMKGFTWVKLNKLAKERISKAIKKAELSDADDFLTLLNAETRMNGGNYTRSNSEDCLIAIKGKGLERKDASIKQVIYACLGEHSQKPIEVHYRLEKLYGEVKRIELFARDKVQGWDLWGNEAPENSVSF
ncbi:MT-A70 family methyltransferase [Arsenophonus nasoniae]|uniref:MT-A70 family methyltransferase n=2 Tax=Arsenophonus nasoniae TaxID=638 RepID=A0ABY8NRD9_9GAMM|nr:MT-A70 family methyltransferase [Arsenophonus nasoniae]WGM06159.1 MT-A70 family methyltransferase [Arsenophonus nasoniae]WGM11123.1 MT-A70 family methyltransferase [Arsenophonus nasoniae]WGM15823.1 MT-A70 family methyltransferase [Arsenophonus nasoniae]